MLSGKPRRDLSTGIFVKRPRRLPPWSVVPHLAFVNQDTTTRIEPTSTAKAVESRGLSRHPIILGPLRACDSMRLSVQLKARSSIQLPVSSGLGSGTKVQDGPDVWLARSRKYLRHIKTQRKIDDKGLNEVWMVQESKKWEG